MSNALLFMIKIMAFFMHSKTKKWYHGSRHLFDKVDPDKLRRGDYGDGFCLTSDLSLAFTYSQGKNVYEVSLSTVPLTMGDKIQLLSKEDNEDKRIKIKKAPSLESKDKRGEICIVRDLNDIVELKRLDIEMVERVVNRSKLSREDEGLTP